VKLTAVDVAALYTLVSGTEAATEHVPTETNATTPDDEPTVHTAVSLLVYVLASDPADMVLVNVGTVAVIT
jgi:hypothetical protein